MISCQIEPDHVPDKAIEVEMSADESSQPDVTDRQCCSMLQAEHRGRPLDLGERNECRGSKPVGFCGSVDLTSSVSEMASKSALSIKEGVYVSVAGGVLVRADVLEWWQGKAACEMAR